ncbi:MAG: hypothetical protein ACLRIS_19220 [Flavonifractor plautii]
MWGSPYDGSDGRQHPQGSRRVLYRRLLGAGGGVQYALRDSEGNQAYIEDDASNPYGVDFIVYGNAFNGNPEADTVQVSEDGKTYMTGRSLYGDPNTLRDVNITYTLSGSDIQHASRIERAQSRRFLPTHRDVQAGAAAWFPTTANYGGVWKTSVVSSDQTVGASAFNGASVTYTGVTLQRTRIPPRTISLAMRISSEWRQLWYGDQSLHRRATTQGGDGFDIAWAVKPDGTPAGQGSVISGYIHPH